MDNNIIKLACYALRSESNDLKGIGWDVIRFYSGKGHHYSILVNGILYYSNWKICGREECLSMALTELRRLPVQYVMEKVPKIKDGDEIMQMIFPGEKGEKKRLHKDLPPSE